MEKYHITITTESRNNSEIVFISEDKNAVKNVHALLVRLQDLQFPQSKSLNKERTETIESLDNLGVSIFGLEPCDWDDFEKEDEIQSIKVYSVTEVNMYE